MKTIRERIGKEWVFFDGGTGSILQKMGLKGGELPERWNLTHPDAIRQLYRGYLEAGVNVFNANTFGANRLHYPDGVDEIITAGIELAKQARTEAGREDAFIALDIGPSGKLLEPLGDLSFEGAVELFAEEVRAGVRAGADLILIETMSDSYEAKAAVLAAKENSDLPVFVTMTFDAAGKLLTGGTVESIVALLEGLRVDALGMNCSLGPREMMPIIRRLTECASLPVIVNPNAGLPETRHGQTVYPVGPDEFAERMGEIADLGVQGLGGCCGTTPEHIRKLIAAVSPKPFRPNPPKQKTVISSYACAVEIGAKPVIIGERINPTGKKTFQNALRNNDIDYIVSQGLQQEDAGAHALDVNVGLPDIDEAAMLETVVKKLQSVTALPLQLDSSDPEALERAIRIYNGKPMINSVNGKPETMEAIFPLIQKYGGVVVGLCLDQTIPATAQERVAIAENILKTAETYGIERKEIVIDGLAMTVSSDSDSGRVTLETIRRCTQELGVHTILGVSNISFGLPQRGLVNAHFLAMAIQSGLSCAIMNPNHEQMMAGYRTANVLLGYDAQCRAFVEAYAGTSERAGIAANQPAAAEPAGNLSLAHCIERGMSGPAEQAARALLDGQKDPFAVINEDIIPALDVVGKGFEAKTVFLPQLLMSADAAKAAFAVIRERLSGTDRQKKGTMILATVKGDIHDIGKNIVKVMLENYGYEVLDLGRDVDPQVIADTAVAKDIRLVGLSALMTTTVGAMEETIRLLRKVKPETKIVVGGAVLTPEYAERIGADAYAKDAMATVRYADKVFNVHE